MTFLEAIKQADERITAIHQAFSAPGDYGYESRQGQALIELYRFQANLRDLLRTAPVMVQAIEKTRTNLEGLSRANDDVFAAMVRRLDSAAAIAGRVETSPPPVQGK